MEQVVLLSALLEPAAAVSVPPVIFSAGRARSPAAIAHRDARLIRFY